MTPARPPAPWTEAQARAVGACDLVALLLVTAAWHASRHEGSLQDQVAWLNLAVLGLLVALVANGFLFLLARRAVGQRRLALLPDLVARAQPAPGPATAEPVLWVPGTARIHVDGCPMVAGKPAQHLSPARARSKRLLPCELCG